MKWKENLFEETKEKETKVKEEETNEKEEDTGDVETKVSAMGGIFFCFYSKTLTVSPISFLLSCKMKGGGYKHEGEG